MLSYPITLEKDKNGTVLATCKDFPELTTYGDNKEEALLHAIDALEEAIAARIENREDVPTPSKGKHLIRLPTQTAIKVIVYQSMREQGVNKAELARRLAWHGPQVDRLLDIRHSTRLDHVDRALAALNRQLSVNAA